MLQIPQNSPLLTLLPGDDSLRLSVAIGATSVGLPASTTHGICGSFFGIGTVTRQANWGVIGKILRVWLITLPMGAAFGAVCYWSIRCF
ncbi:MAG: phosphate/sulfate permease [Planctomycetaceae bacterium]|jgi:phosphate/sulfate permease